MKSYMERQWYDDRLVRYVGIMCSGSDLCSWETMCRGGEF